MSYKCSKCGTQREGFGCFILSYKVCRGCYLAHAHAEAQWMKTTGKTLMDRDDRIRFSHAWVRGE
jgi:hypothetical protein